MGRKKEMLKMTQIDCIKEMQGKGMTPTEICC
jgi:hypothetical protein